MVRLTRIKKILILLLMQKKKKHFKAIKCPVRHIKSKVKGFYENIVKQKNKKKLII